MVVSLEKSMFTPFRELSFKPSEYGRLCDTRVSPSTVSDATISMMCRFTACGGENPFRGACVRVDEVILCVPFYYSVRHVRQPELRGRGFPPTRLI
jgi:hypothetical protein